MKLGQQQFVSDYDAFPSQELQVEFGNIVALSTLN